MNKRVKKEKYIKACDADIVETYIPVHLYYQKVLVVVTNNIKDSRMARRFLFGKYKLKSEPAGLCSSHKGNFGIFLKPPITYATVAHELFHLTHRLMENACAKYSSEPFAYLHGYLADKTFDFLIANKIELFFVDESKI